MASITGPAPIKFNQSGPALLFEIATRNQVSVRAHGKIGFEAIAIYDDGREEWVTVVWDFAGATEITGQ